LPALPVPADNPPTSAKIVLGDRLFRDPRGSSDGKVRCATCHAREKGFTDRRRVSEGRNAPTVINAACMDTLFRDGREPDLEGQSKQPPVDPRTGRVAESRGLLEIIRAEPISCRPA
jgi:cytochrome c peroxidase